MRGISDTAGGKKKLGGGGEQLTVLARAREEFVGSGPSESIMSVMNS